MTEQSKNKSRMGLVIGLVAVALVIVLGFVLLNTPPSSDDLKGTIGGVEQADRYRADQISDAEAILGEPQFQNLVHNEEFLQLLESDNFQEALESDDQFRALKDMPDFQELKAHGALMKELDKPVNRQKWSDAVHTLRMLPAGSNRFDTQPIDESTGRPPAIQDVIGDDTQPQEMKPERKPGERQDLEATDQMREPGVDQRHDTQTTDQMREPEAGQRHDTQTTDQMRESESRESREDTQPIQ